MTKTSTMKASKNILFLYKLSNLGGYNLKLESSVEERILYAFLDIVILPLLANESMTGYQVKVSIEKEFGVYIGTDKIYNILVQLERKGMIRCDSEKHGRTYTTTDQGNTLINNIPKTCEESQRTIRTLLLTRGKKK